MNIANKYNIGDTIFSVTDPEQRPFIITRIVVVPNNFFYVAEYNEIELSFYEFQVNEEESMKIKFGLTS